MTERLLTPEPRPVSPLLTAYQPAAGFYDELLERPGEPRPHYARLIQDLEQFGAPELRHRWDTCRRLVREQGITYNVYDAPGPRERPWQLDPLPFVISADEWRTLETGLVQRATVLNRILSDCYGPQELIRSRWLSPAMVFAQPDFLRPCHGVAAPGGVFLHFYAADLARSPDGRWWVISDRTQVPTGAGYALANRLVTSRILPEAFRDHCVHRLAGFFRDTRNALAQLAPRQAENARVVLLTSGPLNETYFEQAYLARYLGYMLVEGQDLMVRDDRVFLKTLGGLEPVDVILRRLDDDYCDPLELRNDSLLGVPGLLEALRAGNVAIANSLGSGLVESPAFLAFLPGLCRHLLGEELKLPSVATWWCGQKAARQYAFDHLGELIVKPAFRGGSGAIDPSAGLTKAARETLRRRIEFDPDLFVAQERLDFSQAPVWDGNALAPRTIGLRVFLVASGGGYRVMPGALARISPDAGERFLSMQRGGGAKDTWVLSETPVEDVSLLRGYRPSIELGRTGNNLPSRLADNFFWLGRYAERADATARLLRTALARFDPERTTGALPLLSPLLRTLEIQGQLPGLSEKPELRVNAEAFEAELLAAIFDPARPGSLRSLAGQLQRLAMLVRDRTSNDMWRALSRVNERLAMPPARKFMLAGEARGVLTDTLLGLAAFHGLARENMTRAQGWRFLDMGLRIERALYLGTLLHSMLHAPEADDPSVLEAVLDVADSSITFRSRYSLLPHVPSVLDLLLLDERNPRSVLFQLNQLARHFNQLPPEREQAPGSGSMLLRDCLARIDRVESREHPAASVKPAASAAAAALGGILRDLPRISNAIAASYFAHSTLSRTGRDQAG